MFEQRDCKQTKRKLWRQHRVISLRCLFSPSFANKVVSFHLLMNCPKKVLLSANTPPITEGECIFPVSCTKEIKNQFVYFVNPSPKFEQMYNFPRFYRTLPSFKLFCCVLCNPIRPNFVSLTTFNTYKAYIFYTGNKSWNGRCCSGIRTNLLDS